MQCTRIIQAMAALAFSLQPVTTSSHCTFDSNLVSVLVASRRIPPGGWLGESNTHFVRLHKTDVMADAVTSRTELELESKASKVDLAAGNQITFSMLHEVGHRHLRRPSPFPANVRVCRIPVSPSSYEQAKPVPGTLVDILLQYGPKPGRKSHSIYEMVNDVEVFAVETAKTNEEPCYLSVLVSLDEALLLKIAPDKGVLLISTSAF